MLKKLLTNNLRPIKVLIADDYYVVREGIKQLLKNINDKVLI